MREIALFAEDLAHRIVVDSLLQRLAAEKQTGIQTRIQIASGGFGAVKTTLTKYLRDLRREHRHHPDLIVVATDANCHGSRQRIAELGEPDAPAPLVHAIPDPHIERWLLLDGAAFATVFGRGCDAPDQKCERNRYKRLLAEAIRDTGHGARLGGIEHAPAIVQALDLRRARRDPSFDRFADGFGRVLTGWAE